MTFAIAFHFVYIAFEPVPRYAFTAMPLIIVLAAAGLVGLLKATFELRKRERQQLALKFVFLVLLFVVVATAFYTFRSPLLSVLANISLDSLFLRSTTAASLCAFFILLGWAFLRLIHRLNLGGPLADVFGIKLFLLTAMIAGADALYNPAFFECSQKIGQPGHDIHAQLFLPSLGKSVPPTVFLLVDCQSENGAPHLRIIVNGRRRSAITQSSALALPLYEYTAAAKDIPTLINLQTRMMDIDQRGIRQWWIFPVSADDFHFGAENTISLALADGEKNQSGVKLFGDLNAPRKQSIEAFNGEGETINTPSLTSFSWSKGFLTADCRDPRVYEKLYFRGLARGWSRDAQILPGTARVRLAVPVPGSGSESGSGPGPGSGQNSEGIAQDSLTLLELPGEREVTGTNPLSLAFTSKSIPVQRPLAGASLLNFRAKMKTNHADVPATLALGFEIDGKQTFYTPAWQPSCLRLAKEWQAVEFNTVLPASCTAWKVIKAHLLLSPYTADRFYLHPKQALQDRLSVQDLQIEILPPLLPGSSRDTALKLL